MRIVFQIEMMQQINKMDWFPATPMDVVSDRHAPALRKKIIAKLILEYPSTDMTPYKYIIQRTNDEEYSARYIIGLVYYTDGYFERITRLNDITPRLADIIIKQTIDWREIINVLRPLPIPIREVIVHQLMPDQKYRMFGTCNFFQECCGLSLIILNNTTIMFVCMFHGFDRKEFFIPYYATFEIIDNYNRQGKHICEYIKRMVFPYDSDDDYY